MKLLLFLSFSLLSLHSFSQNPEIEADYELQGYLKNYKEFDFEKLLATKFNHISEIDTKRSIKKYSREIDFNFTEDLYEISIEYISGNTIRSMDYNLRVFKENDKVFGVIVSEELWQRKYFYFDYDKLHDYVEKHNTFYGSEKSMRDFINETKDGEVYTYYCGFSAPIKKIPSYDGHLFNNKKNVDVFKNWLYSFNIEKQNYGIDALEYLTKKGKIELTENDIKAIDHIKKRNSILETCSGCLMGIYKKRY